MSKVCAICGRAAAYGVIDKFGFMNPGSLCPSHYISWSTGGLRSYVIFLTLPGGELTMQRFIQERAIRRLHPGDLKLAIEPKHQTRTMSEIKFDAIATAYENNNHNAEAACRELKISKATFYRELRRNDYHTDRELKKRRAG